MKELDWNEMSKLGLIEKINSEILHPLGLAMYRDPNTGLSGGAWIAEDLEWQYGYEPCDIDRGKIKQVLIEKLNNDTSQS